MSEIALPYPVLGRADDYINVDFQATIKVDECEIEVGERITLPFSFDLSDEAILDLIDQGKAKYGFEISCSSTSIRYVEFVDESGELILDPTKFFQKVNFSPRVFVVDDIEAFYSANFNPEFGDAVYKLEPGDFLAATDDDAINVDFTYLRFEDAIKVRKQIDLSPWIYSFGLDGTSIIIGMGAKFHDHWVEAKESKIGRPHLIASVYKDCMVAALEHISFGHGDGSLAWERGLAEMLDEKEITVPEKASFNELNSIAQQIMENDGIKKVSLI